MTFENILISIINDDINKVLKVICQQPEGYNPKNFQSSRKKIHTPFEVVAQILQLHMINFHYVDQ